MAKEKVEFKEVNGEEYIHPHLLAIFASIWVGIILLVLFNLDKISHTIEWFFNLW